MPQYQEIREALLARSAVLERRMGRIRGDRRQERGPLEQDFAEQAVELENDEVLDALDDAGFRELAEIRDALARIEAGTYGTCTACEEGIPISRLRVMPTTQHCVACAE